MGSEKRMLRRQPPILLITNTTQKSLTHGATANLTWKMEFKKEWYKTINK